jgi:hypothetical protein
MQNKYGGTHFFTYRGGTHFFTWFPNFHICSHIATDRIFPDLSHVFVIFSHIAAEHIFSTYFLTCFHIYPHVVLIVLADSQPSIDLNIAILVVVLVVILVVPVGLVVLVAVVVLVVALVVLIRLDQL